MRLPYHLSAVTQAVARAALAHSGELMAQVDSLRAERDAANARTRELADALKDGVALVEQCPENIFGRASNGNEEWPIRDEWLSYAHRALGGEEKA